MSLVKQDFAATANQPEEKPGIPIDGERFVAQWIRVGEQDERSLAEWSLDDHVAFALNGDNLPFRL